jgi:DNA-binding FadR family transcriptional regulator
MQWKEQPHDKRYTAGTSLRPSWCAMKPRTRQRLAGEEERTGNAAEGRLVLLPELITTLPRPPRDVRAGGRAPRASESVAAQLRFQILSGSLPAGSRFPPEVELAAAYDVSRPTIREALHILESDRLISIKRGKQGGATVQPPSTSVLAKHAGLLLQFRNATIADVLAARALLEPRAAAVVAIQRQPEAIHLLREHVTLEATGRSDAVAQELGERFHELLVELAGNHTLRIYAAMINRIVSVHMSRLGSSRTEERHRLRGEHRRLVELIEAGADVEAEKCWRDHLSRFNARLLTDVPHDTTVLDVMR